MQDFLPNLQAFIDAVKAGQFVPALKTGADLVKSVMDVLGALGVMGAEPCDPAVAADCHKQLCECVEVLKMPRAAGAPQVVGFNPANLILIAQVLQLILSRLFPQPTP